MVAFLRIGSGRILELNGGVERRVCDEVGRRIEPVRHPGRGASEHRVGWWQEVSRDGPRLRPVTVASRPRSSIAAEAKPEITIGLEIAPHISQGDLHVLPVGEQRSFFARLEHDGTPAAIADEVLGGV